MTPTAPIEYAGHRESKKFSKTGLDEMMGKTRKVSKGYSSGFVPDYRHAVETMAESEGFGSSGRVDTEIMASEDSCAPRRKSVNLNGGTYDRFGVPIQVVRVAKMSRSERKDLERRLTTELEQVQILQRRLASMGSNAVPMSPASDIRSSSDGIRRPVLENFNRPVNEMTMPMGKKKAPLGRNGPRTKGVGAKRPETVKQALPLPPSTNNVILMKQCETLLQRLMSQEYAWVFNEPVDVVKLNIPDYFNIIKQPMDLGTVKRKLYSGQYLDPFGFAADVRLTFSNAMTYNPPENDVHFMAKTLSKFFEVRWKQIEKKLPIKADSPLASKPSIDTEGKIATSMPPLKKMKSVTAENEVKQEPARCVMSALEKQKLSSELEELLEELPESIVNFLKESSYNPSQAAEDEIEIDVDALSDDILFTLRKLLDDFISSKQKSQGKAEHCEIELHNESGFSNSSVQPYKGTDLADEEVDIGGNDAPISSFPPVEIEKDGVGPNGKCSSSSSSSSDSGSSSSDSDTGSSSGGESDAVKDKAPANNEKEIHSSGASLEQKRSDLGAAGTDTGDTMNVHVQQDSQCSLDSADFDGCQEGGNAPPERQVSPGKNDRAALLRSRFADTILKAQEKALQKGEKLDLERLRLEREELERKRKEDKARLLAEARAAEEARRKAETEAKRKRELEREAARQALQKMEKTVDINENSQFLEDLEMFRAAPEQSLVEVASPNEDQDGLGSFNFQVSSNPLQQLGLYMKDDDEEEEEVEPQSAKSAEDDAEEGEID